MVDVALTDGDGTPLLTDDGLALIAYSVQTAPPVIAGHGAADYAAALYALLPSGRVWPRDLGSALGRTVSGMVPGWARSDARSRVLLQDAPAGDLLELLPEWEATLGLPDPCIGADPSVAQRQRSVVAQLASRGGQSVPYFVGVGKALGFTIQIREFAPARADAMRADDAANEPVWANALSIPTNAYNLQFFRADEGRADERLETYGSRVLECVLGRLLPAHSIVTYVYPGT